jgi:hypothetical protein
MTALSITENAKFSGKGVPMCSRSGTTTISQFVAFKHGFSNDEIKSTGLKQPASPTKMQEAVDRDQYANMKPKIFTNAGKKEGGQSGIHVDSKVLALRNELERKRTKAGEEHIKEIVEKAVDQDGKTFLEKYCRG